MRLNIPKRHTFPRYTACTCEHAQPQKLRQKLLCKHRWHKEPDAVPPLADQDDDVGLNHDNDYVSEKYTHIIYNADVLSSRA